MANQQDINALRKFAQTHCNSWIILRDDLGKKPTLLFKYQPESWNMTDDQVGLGNPEDGNPPYVFWGLNKGAQWEIVNESNNTVHIKGPVKWCIQSFGTEEEIDEKIRQLKAM